MGSKMWAIGGEAVSASSLLQQQCSSPPVAMMMHPPADDRRLSQSPPLPAAPRWPAALWQGAFVSLVEMGGLDES